MFHYYRPFSPQPPGTLWWLFVFEDAEIWFCLQLFCLFFFCVQTKIDCDGFITAPNVAFHIQLPGKIKRYCHLYSHLWLLWDQISGKGRVSKSKESWWIRGKHTWETDRFALAIMLLTSKKDENRVQHHLKHTVHCRGGQSDAETDLERIHNILFRWSLYLKQLRGTFIFLLILAALYHHNKEQLLSPGTDCWNQTQRQPFRITSLVYTDLYMNSQFSSWWYVMVM